MEDDIIESGWVSIQTGFFRSISKCWMVLTPNALYTFKQKGDSAYAQKLPL